MHPEEFRHGASSFVSSDTVAVRTIDNSVKGMVDITFHVTIAGESTVTTESLKFKNTQVKSFIAHQVYPQWVLVDY